MTDERIAQARKLRKDGISYPKIAAILESSSSTVYRVLNPEAKERDRIHSAEYYKTHWEQAVRYATKYHKAHPEQRRKSKHKYYKRHKDEIRLRDAEYYEEHKGSEAFQKHRHLYAVEYRKAHKNDEAFRELNRLCTAEYRKVHKNDEAYRENNRLRCAKHYKEHPAEYKAAFAKRRALVRGATIGNLAEIAEVYRRAKEDPKVRCYLCGKLIPLGYRHVDHIVPLSKGGAHRPSNLAVACDECNMHKHDKLPEEIGVLL